MMFLVPTMIAVLVVPWIAGILSIFRYLSGKKQVNRGQLADELEAKIGNIQDPVERKGYLKAIENLKLGYNLQTDDDNYQEDSKPTGLSDHMDDSTQSNLSYQQETHEIPENYNVPESKNIPTTKSLDNVNILLYLGSFLVVVAAGIFVGFNYQLMSGFAKVLFLLIFTLTFYIVGLYLYVETEKMKPAGMTFTTIGIILFPLNGLAFYKFVTEGLHGNVVWFVTSLLTLIFYSVALKYTKKIYLNYLSAFVCLSIFESFVSLFEFPVYYLFWGMVLYSMIVTIYTKVTKKEYEINKPLMLSANIISPLSILGSLVMTSEFGIFSLGINVLLAAVYYILLYFITEEDNNKDIFLALSSILFPIGISAIIADKCPDKINYVTILLAMSAIYLLISKVYNKYLTENRITILSIIAAVIASISCVIAAGNSELLLLSLAITMIVGISGYYFNKNTFCLIISFISLLILPTIFADNIHTSLSLPYLRTILYATVCVLLFGIDYFSRKKESTDLSLLAFASYIISTVTTLMVSITTNDPVTIIVIELLLSASYFVISSYKDQRAFDYVGGFLFYLTSYQLAEKFSIYNINYIWILFAMAVIFYVSGLFKSDDESRSRHWRFIGLIGLVASSVLMYADKGNCAQFILMLLTFGTGGLLESNRENNEVAKYFSYAVMVTALEFALDLMHVEEQHVYTAIWSIYFGVLAYNNHRNSKYSNRDSLAVIALILLTVPLFFQAINSYDNGHIYGLILGIESIIILLFGMNFRYKLMIWWGSIALSIIVLDQTKDALFALPKWIIVGGVGLLFLGGAVYLLSKNNSEKR